MWILVCVLTDCGRRTWSTMNNVFGYVWAIWSEFVMLVSNWIDCWWQMANDERFLLCWWHTSYSFWMQHFRIEIWFSWQKKIPTYNKIQKFNARCFRNVCMERALLENINALRTYTLVVVRGHLPTSRCTLCDPIYTPIQFVCEGNSLKLSFSLYFFLKAATSKAKTDTQKPAISNNLSEINENDEQTQKCTRNKKKTRSKITKSERKSWSMKHKVIQKVRAKLNASRALFAAAISWHCSPNWEVCEVYTMYGKDYVYSGGRWFLRRLEGKC